MLKFRRFRVVLFGILLVVLPLWAGAQDALPTLTSTPAPASPSTFTPSPPTQIGPTLIPSMIKGNIQIGETITSQHTGGVDQVLYAFQGEAGQRLNATLYSESRTQGCLTLHDDADSPIPLQYSYSDYTGLTTAFFFDLTMNSTYFLSLKGACLIGKSYTLSLTLVIEEQIAYDQSITGEIRIPGETARYRFHGEAGDLIAITIVADNVDPVISLAVPGTVTFNLPTDNDRNRPGNQNNFIGPIVLASASDYLIVVRGNDNISTGQYSLFLDKITPTTITYGETLQVSFDDETSMMMYTFDGEIGDTVNVQVSSNDSIDTTLTLTDSGNFDVVYNDDDGSGFDPEIIAHPLLSNGQYRLLLRPFNIGDTGQVSLSLLRNKTYSLDENTQVIRLDSKRRKETLEFNGTAGQAVRLTMQILSGTNNSARVTAAQGQQAIIVTTLSSGNLMSVEFVVPVDGIVRVEVDITSSSSTSSVIQVSLERLDNE